MNAQELRIGNWVFDGFQHFQITAQDIYIIADIHNGLVIKPITLTEEWLLKFGAEMYEFDNGQPNQYRIQTELYVIRDGVITDYGTSVKLPFVHTLQNLYFAKRNEELTLIETK